MATEQTNTPPANSGKAAPADKKARTAAAGDEVIVVTAAGEHVPAKVDKARGPKVVDLSFDYRDEPVTITGAKLDETGKTPDTWHFPA